MLQYPMKNREAAGFQTTQRRYLAPRNDEKKIMNTNSRRRMRRSVPGIVSTAGKLGGENGEPDISCNAIFKGSFKGRQDWSRAYKL